MRLLLMHLSDLHITNSQDPVLNRNLQIADSVKNLDYTLDLCVVAITGDLAYSGKEDQSPAAPDECGDPVRVGAGESFPGRAHEEVDVGQVEEREALRRRLRD